MLRRDLVKSDGVSAIDDLYHELFGDRPAKAGTAYERLAAITLAVLGWENVRQDERYRRAGKETLHQLDVTAKHPDGSIKRLIVECKDWEKTVGKKTLDALVGVRGQVGGDAAAVVTTKTFTRGARSVAVDEDVALIILRSFDEDPVAYIKAVEAELNFFFPARSGWSFEFAEVPADLRGDHTFALSSDLPLEHADGSPAGEFDDILVKHTSPMEQGRFECRADLDPPLWFPTVDGLRVPVSAVEWVEENHLHVETIRTEAKGKPKLVLQQLDENGNPTSGRVVVDADLFAWDVAPDGRVVARGSLAVSE